MNELPTELAASVGRVAARLAGEVWGGKWTYGTIPGTSVSIHDTDPQNAGSKPEEGQWQPLWLHEVYWRIGFR